MKKINTLIIGGTSSFGKAIAKELNESNHNLTLTYYTKKDEEFNNAIQLDVTDTAQIDKFVNKLEDKFTNLVYSVSAPIEFKTIDKESWEDFDRHFRVQVKGLWQLSNALIKQGHALESIVLIGSSAVFNTPPARLTSYTVGKYALLGLMKAMTNELAQKNIRVNMISPGASGEGLSSIYPEKFLEIAKTQTPLKRLVKASDVAKLAKYLLSKDADYLTGVNIPLDGGINMI